MQETHRLPYWFKQKLPDAEKVHSIRGLLRAGRLHTVCESAHCPNLGTCWSRGTATFMILGSSCTRACRFCAVPAGRPQEVNGDEPRQVALAAQRLNLKYVVVTSVARDDLPDEGAGQFAQTINEIRKLLPGTKVEVLVPDFSGKIDNLKIVTDAAPEVLSHNIETVARLSPEVRPQADYQRSLKVLRTIRTLDENIIVKSGFMAGLGESLDEIAELMRDLLEGGCHILTIGQYLSPSSARRHLPVKDFLSPGDFESLRHLGLEMGFKYVQSGPLVRSSYIAEEGYRKCLAAIKITA